MNNYEATEIAYKNGYAKGYAESRAEAFKKWLKQPAEK